MSRSLAIIAAAIALSACQSAANAETENAKVERGSTLAASPASHTSDLAESSVSNIGQVGTDPFIVVLDTRKGGPGSGVAWWLRDMDIRPTGKSVSGVSIDVLNAHRGEASAPWCSANAQSRDSFRASSPDTQAEIDQSMADTAYANFAVRGANITGEGLQDAVVGSFQSCEGQIGTFLLITDRVSRPNIVQLEEWPDFKGLIWVRERAGGLFVGSCFECDAEMRIDLPAGAFPNFQGVRH